MNVDIPFLKINMNELNNNTKIIKKYLYHSINNNVQNHTTKHYLNHFQSLNIYYHY